MASIPPLRRVLLPTTCAILIIFLLLGTRPSYKTVTRSSKLRWATIWRKPSFLPAPDGVKTSRLHYLIPASHTTAQFCENLVSSAINRYSVPVILGWNATGEYDATVSHLAKLRAVKRHLHGLKPRHDDDLVLIVDAYDIIHQLPAQIMIERYFEVAERADVELAARFNISVADARKRNLRQTVFWGPDKFCFPFDPRAARCWAVPPSSLGPHAFGPHSGNGKVAFNEPRWLNSGTVIGPVGDVRRLVDATMAEINATYDESFELRNSDQYYLANVWARQEYWRSKEAAHGGEVIGGPADRIVPELQADGSEAELHIALDYESALFQTKNGNERYLIQLAFDQDNATATVKTDVLEAGDKFQPYPIAMSSNLRAALMEMWDSIPDAHKGIQASDWIRTVNLGVNLVTKNVYALWHCTGAKDGLDTEYSMFWWHAYAESLLKAAVKSSRTGRKLISERLIDGRRWAAQNTYPSLKRMGNDHGGAWSDAHGGSWVPWADLCEPHEEFIFQGERRRAGAPVPLNKRAPTKRQW